MRIYKYRCKVPGYFSLAEIKDVLERAKQSFGSDKFIGLTTDTLQMASFELKGTLDSVDLLKGITFSRATVHGEFEPKDFPAETFANILQSSEADVGSVGCIQVYCRFYHKTSEPDQKIGEDVGAEIRKGKKEFRFLSAVIYYQNDQTIRKQWVNEIIQKAQLPVVMIEKDGNYFLEHKQGLKLYGGQNKNPASINCEIPTASASDLVQRMELIFRENVALEKKITYEWMAMMAYTNDPVESKRLLANVIARRFPAQKTKLDFSYQLNDLSGVESLHALSGKKSSFLTQLCAFGPAEDSSGELSMFTSAKGHELSVSVSDSEIIEEVGRKLGLELIPNEL
jgi:hypothetical protein